MTPLAEKIRNHLRRSGPVPFSSFMGMALYDADLGYYARGPGRTGRSGDFFTSVSVGPVFGELMAGQFCEVWEQLGQPADFVILERGASDGAFARDVLTWITTQRPDFAAALTYWIDEPLPRLAVAQQENLAAFAGKVQWGCPAAATGVFFANELLDAIPFRRVRFTAGGWRELCVGLEGDDFAWVETEVLDGATQRRLTLLGTDFPEGYETEIAPAVASEMRLASAAIARGALFLFDYGYSAAEYYGPSRRTGTLRCYRQHLAHEDPFDAVGETDITAHVDFTFATRAALAAGCSLAGFLDQGRFLTGAAESAIRAMDGRMPGPETTRWLRQFQTLTHPTQMGRLFHALVLGKDLPADFQLTGLRHARADHGLILDGRP